MKQGQNQKRKTNFLKIEHSFQDKTDPSQEVYNAVKKIVFSYDFCQKEDAFRILEKQGNDHLDYAEINKHLVKKLLGIAADRNVALRCIRHVTDLFIKSAKDQLSQSQTDKINESLHILKKLQLFKIIEKLEFIGDIIKRYKKKNNEIIELSDSHSIVNEKLSKKRAQLIKISKSNNDKDTEIQKLKAQVLDLATKLKEILKVIPPTSNQNHENLQFKEIQEKLKIKNAYYLDLEKQHLQMKENFAEFLTKNAYIGQINDFNSIFQYFNEKNTTIASLKKDLAKKQQFIEHLSKENEFFKKQAEKQSSGLSEEMEKMRKNFRKIKQENQELLSQKNTFNKQLSNLKCEYLLPESTILHSKDFTSKQFLISAIRNEFRVQAKKFKLLFSFQQKNTMNFHDFFDDKPNILLLVELDNGGIIGGFTKDPFKPDTSGKNGFIFNLTYQEVYKLNQKFATQYDKLYIIFGNSEIRIKSCEKLVFSNFGVNNSFFSTDGKDVNSFLGKGNLRESGIRTYEIYQAIQQ